MLLNIVTQISDQESLLQKHFTALLSSVWKAKLREKRLLSSQNHINCGRGPLSSIMSTIAQNSVNSLSEKLKFGNPLQSKKLISTALDETINRQQDITVPLPKWMETNPVIHDNLEITIEFQRYEELAPSFPPAVSLLIKGADPASGTSTSYSHENDHGQRSAGPKVEDRFRYFSFFLFGLQSPFFHKLSGLIFPYC